MKQKARGDLNGFLDAGSHIQGELHFEDTFRVDGRLSGKAISTGDLVVGENGVVEAEIEVGSVFVSGTVRGTIRATDRIEIAAGAKVLADLETPTLVVEDGATLEGYCKMSPQRSKVMSDLPRTVVAKLPMSNDG
jgi:cytoskeletal protein CcmA (bactofilin family)